MCKSIKFCIQVAYAHQYYAEALEWFTSDCQSANWYSISFSLYRLTIILWTIPSLFVDIEAAILIPVSDDHFGCIEAFI